MVVLEIVLALAVVAGTGGKPKAFPELDWDAMKYSVAIVDVEESGGLPGIPECEGKDVICLHSPSWLRAKVRSVVAGSPLPAEFHASTSGHYGPVKVTGDADQPALMLLAASGGDLVMIRYADASLYTDGRGELHLPVESARASWWLPCSVASIATPVTDRTLALGMAHPIDQSSGVVKEDRFTRVEGRAYWPSMTIPMAKLKSHLATAKDVRPDFSCPPEDEPDDGYGFFSIIRFATEDKPAVD